MKKFLFFLAIAAALYIGYRYYKKKKDGEQAPDFLPPAKKKVSIRYRKLSDKEVDSYAKNAANILPSLVTSPDTKDSFLSSLLILQKESLKAIATRFQLSYSVAGQTLANAVENTQGARPDIINKVVTTLKKIL